MEDVTVFCPLGSKCSEIKDNKIHRCLWYVKLRGKDPQSEEMFDDWRCVMAWLPVMLVENAQVNRGNQAAVESFRNEMVKGQQEFNDLVKISMSQKMLKSLT